MKYNSTDVLLRAGFATIAKYDPALYARMVKEDFTVSTNYRESFPMLWQAVPSHYRGQDGAFGITISADKEPWQEVSGVFLNRPAVHRWARLNGVPIEMFAAAVLAHEFVHIHNSETDPRKSEPPAFRAGSEFATKLPYPYGQRIKAMSDAVMKEILSGQAPDYGRV